MIAVVAGRIGPAFRAKGQTVFLRPNTTWRASTWAVSARKFLRSKRRE
jgi:hypothetical protein